jgi:hypothetical protein
MQTIVIAHRDSAFAEARAEDLRRGGYRVITCPGPWPPERCVRCDKGYCPLTEAAELMIYDPQLTAPDAAGVSHTLAIDSAVAHPDVPMLLAFSPGAPVDVGTLRSIRAEAPNVHLAAHEPDGLLRQVGTLLGAQTD